MTESERDGGHQVIVRLSVDVFDRLTLLAGKYSKMSPLGMKVGRATVAREAMLRGMATLESELEPKVETKPENETTEAT